jgi:hypothetical protein
MAHVPMAAVSGLVVLCGIVAVLYTVKARGKLSEGLLKEYVGWVFLSMWLITSGMFLHFLGMILGMEETVVAYLGLLLIGSAFVTFAQGANKLYRMSINYGFKEEGAAIGKIIEERKTI